MQTIARNPVTKRVDGWKQKQGWVLKTSETILLCLNSIQNQIILLNLSEKNRK